MSNKTPPFPNYKEWTTARFFTFIRSGLRERFNRWPPKYKTLTNAQRKAPVLDKDGNHLKYKTGKRQGEERFVNEYQCNHCKEWFKQKEVQVDHIIPVGTLKSFEDLGPFAERLFVSEEGLQVLCTSCHHLKTQMEKG